MAGKQEGHPRRGRLHVGKEVRMPAQKVAPPPKRSKSGNPAKRALEGG
jgi:hypothetical protein